MSTVKPRMAFLDTLISKMNEENLSLDDVQEEVDTFMFRVKNDGHFRDISVQLKS